MSKELENWPNKYTQREWDRTVGWGEVPQKYKLNDPIWDKRWTSDNDEEVQTPEDKSTRDKSNNN